MKRALLLAVLFSICSNAHADLTFVVPVFDFGAIDGMNLVRNQEFTVRGTIKNTGAIPLNFGCALTSQSCSTLRSFSTSLTHADDWPGDNLALLNFTPGALNQFQGLMLMPNQSFDFTFGTIRPDAPQGTFFHFNFDFQIDFAPGVLPFTHFEAERWAGVFVANQFSTGGKDYVRANAEIPEPSSLWLIICGLAGVGVCVIGDGRFRRA